MSPSAEAPRDRPDHGVAIVVLGMHRGGTSLAAGLIGRLGAALPRDAMAATEDNGRGYFESVGIVRAGDRLVRAARSSWFDPRPLGLDRLPDPTRAAHRADLGAAIDAAFGGAPLIVVKDPRQCRFVPLLEATLAEQGYAMRCVLVVRGADEVAASLAARDGTTPDYARLLWLRHMLDAERDSRAAPRAIVRFDALVDAPEDAVAALARLLGLPAKQPGSDLPDRGLRHHRGVRLREEFAALGEIVREAEAAFDALAREDGEATRERLDGIAARLAAMLWLEGDVAHDELRHRRVPAPAITMAEPEPAPPPPAPATPMDEDETVRTIRDSGLFDRDYYLATYPDVAASGRDPIAHYVAIGAAEGRNPSALFNTGFYARQMLRRSGSDAA